MWNVASHNFGIYFRKFRQPALKFLVRGNPIAGLLSLPGCFEQKLSNPAGSQALHQIKKWAVLESPSTTAVCFATRQKLPNQGGSHQIRRGLKLAQQIGFLFLQCARCCFFEIKYLNHKIVKNFRVTWQEKTKVSRDTLPTSSLQLLLQCVQHHLLILFSFRLGECSGK